MLLVFTTPPSIDYRLVIICSNQDEEKCHIISKLHPYRRPYGVPGDINMYRRYLQKHFVSDKGPAQQTKGTGTLNVASAVDRERYSVDFFTVR